MGKKKSTIRRKAEKQIQSDQSFSGDLKAMTPEQVEEMVYELRVHQVELEMQNEELSRAYQELETVKNQYTDLYDNAPAGYISSDLFGNIIRANNTFATILDAPLYKLVHSNLAAWCFNDDFYLHCRKTVNQDGYARSEFKMKRSDGSVIWVSMESKLKPSEPESENPIIWTVISDITDRKASENLIQESLEEKETLLQEIHHRVKNNIQVISGLLKLQYRNTEDEQTKKILMESQNRIYAISAIHETLHGSDNLSRINLRSYLSKVISAVFQAFNTNRDNITLNSHIDALLISINQAYPLGLVINELISNTMKHAFPDNRKGWITISTKEVGPLLQLTVSDNGVGMSADMDLDTSKSLGLKLVRTLVTNQLGGSVTFEKGNGTTFRIKFHLDENS